MAHSQTTLLLGPPKPPRVHTHTHTLSIPNTAHQSKTTSRRDAAGSPNNSVAMSRARTDPARTTRINHKHLFGANSSIGGAVWYDDAANFLVARSGFLYGIQLATTLLLRHEHTWWTLDDEYYARRLRMWCAYRSKWVLMMNVFTLFYIYNAELHSAEWLIKNTFINNVWT